MKTSSPGSSRATVPSGPGASRAYPQYHAITYSGFGAACKIALSAFFLARVGHNCQPAPVRITRCWLSAVLLASVLCVSTHADANSESNAPLYLLTYDHGGLILWGTDHFAERLRNAMAWLDRYPGFKIGIDNEAYVYDDLAEHDPKLLDELRGCLVKYRGRFGLGTCTYGQPLSTFIDGESNIRQIAYALKTDRQRLGCAPEIYLMSEHAMHSQIPQIISGLGFRGAIMRTHFMMYGYNPVFNVPVGWWVGLDGSRIAAVPTYPGQGAEFGRTTVDNWFLTRFPGAEMKLSPEDFRRQFADIRPLLASRADDSGLRKEELVRRYEGNPEYRWVLLEDLPGILPKPANEMRTMPNDFHVRMPWGYCGNEIWNRNRQAEVSVLTAERLAALELWSGGTNHEPELERAWKNLLVGQHHDIQICGLLPEARKFLGASLAASSNCLEGSLRFIASKLKSEGLTQVTVFNPLSWKRREWIQVDVIFGRGQTTNVVVMHEGTTVPSTLLHAQRSSSRHLLEGRLAFLADLPPLAVAAYSVVSTNALSTQQPKVQVDAQALRIRTPFYEAQFAAEGGLASLVDARTGGAVFQPGKRSACFEGQVNGTNCLSSGRWTLHVAGEDAPWAVAREYGFIGGIPYTFEIRFAADTPRLDCKAAFHFEDEKLGQVSQDRRDARSPFIHEQKLRFKVFPAIGSDAVGIRDLPFAVSETTNRYVEGLYWMAISDGRNGFAFLNRGTMGAVREKDGAFSLPLAYSMFYIWGTRILNGDLAYEFAFEPFTGSWSDADLERKALEYNFPAVSSTAPRGSGESGETFQPLVFGPKAALVTALYPQDGKVYGRLFACEQPIAAVSIRSASRPIRVHRTNLSGSESGQSTGDATALQRWQFGTFRIESTPRQN